MSSTEPYDIMLTNLSKMFVEQIPFHALLGITIHRDHDSKLSIQLNHDEKLIGNSINQILHGGVIATLLDAVGGLTAFASVLKKLSDFPTAEQLQQLSKGATVDLRIDYLRPGVGQYFVGTADVLRSGSKVTVTRMQLHNNNHELIAVGSGTYLISL